MKIKVCSVIKEKVVQKLNEMLKNVNSDDKKEQLTKILTKLINIP
ncbi:hypothetical protein [Vulcanisaeta distributa]|uniref:Uncharacterized protein n=1 Tax=Vulcanisaeta distributa (strain DSM 14429 / JCM 11212 / NBRC 100878 / IC-017) TaxID=572478 RepID=E1QPT5_VULDI|nr:hypothetical protein [Vulcanisaeta distributa]ADN51495.1 hypothetical protein Vdis_2126 [Vulcanisaeta distributa DSM 14429]